MIYRRDLIEHFQWLAGSELLDDALDEAVVAIAFAARGLRHELVQFGAAWVFVDYNVERYELEEFVERERSRLLLPPARLQESEEGRR